MTAKGFISAVRFLAAPVLALLQFWVLWGVCNSFALIGSRILHSQVEMTEALPAMARGAALTGLFLILAGMLWSWVARIDGAQAAMWFVVLAVTVALSPLLLGDASGDFTSLPIRLILAVAVAGTLYLGSSVSGKIRRRTV
jgi:hypothetical protein